MGLNLHTLEALTFDSYKVLDLETTGLDPETDEIIEIGIVEIERGDISTHYNQLFKPTIPIPRVVVQLTGIKPEDCEDKPRIHDVIDEIIPKLDSGWLIAHNADFDISFLRHTFRRYGIDQDIITVDRILDTLELSRILLPWLPNHRLITIAEHFDIPLDTTHRALADADITNSVFRELIHTALGLDFQSLEILNRILNGASDGLRLFFQSIWQFHKGYGSGKTMPAKKGPTNILGQPHSEETYASLNKLPYEEIKQFFQENGLLSTTLPGYEPRTPQVEMALAVAKAFNQEAFLIAEAGTGVGKSLAYLLPALIWSTINRLEHVIVSTHTKTLQDQLFTKDLPLLADVWKDKFSAVLLKGRGNYLCQRRWQAIAAKPQDKFNKFQSRRLLPLVVWSSETRTGDIEENTGFQKNYNRQIWAEINSEGRQCGGSYCEYEGECYYQRVRKASRYADIVLVNHALLFSDAAAGFNVLGNYDTLIIDEAHQIERIATDCLGTLFNKYAFQEMLQRLYQPGSRPKGLLPSIQDRQAKGKHKGALPDDLMRSIQQLIDETQFLSTHVQTLFSEMTSELSGNFDGQNAYLKKRIQQPDDIFDPHYSGIQQIIETLGRMTSFMNQCISQLNNLGLEFAKWIESSVRELESNIEQCDLLIRLVSHFTKDEYESNVVWYEIRPRGYEKDLHFYSVPLNIAGLLSEVLFPRLKRCVMTSATLSVAGEFDYLMHRLGLDLIERDRVTTRFFGSPFDFNEQMRFIIPTFLSSPKEKSFTSDTAALLENTVLDLNRGTLVLFTSHQMLRDVHRSIASSYDERGRRLLGQGIDGSRSNLLRAFQEDTTSVLLGTSSFWEGVDVPGSSLELVIITKIPFDVPTEPLVEARMAEVQAESGNGFINYAVPEAIVKFRQGFGRLIRSGEDRGAVVLLDNRILTSYYGKLILDSLPVAPILCNDWDEFHHALNDWFL